MIAVFGFGGKYISGSGVFEHDVLGAVKYTVRSGARRIVARWRADMLHLSIPPYMTENELLQVLRSMQSKLLSRRPQDAPYAFGQRFVFPDFAVSIIAVDKGRHRCSVHQLGRSDFEVRLSSEVEIGAPETVKAVSNAMRAVARYVAPRVILPRAKELATEVRRQPLGWEISSGLRVLGRCNSNGVIALSYVIVFLPQHLRDYIIYHELAHLSEMNHSAAFHKLCNQYCGGNERQLIAELKTFKFPVV